jgi:prepilin-type N-terminal cleavage/methylation domain-containing protein
MKPGFIDLHHFIKTQGEKGFTLMEVVLALGIMSFVCIGMVSLVMGGLKVSFQSSDLDLNFISAEAIAKSEMENVKSQTYSLANPPSYGYLTGIPSEYNVTITPVRMDPQGDGTGNDDGIQRITITVARSGYPTVQYVGYKVK